MMMPHVHNSWMRRGRGREMVKDLPPLDEDDKEVEKEEENNDKEAFMRRQ